VFGDRHQGDALAALLDQIISTGILLVVPDPGQAQTGFTECRDRILKALLAKIQHVVVGQGAVRDTGLPQCTG